METYHNINIFPNVKETVVTIGTFDGLHRGHQEIVKKVKTLSKTHGSKAVLITFDPHPRHILDEGQKLPMLMDINKKLEMLDTLGLDIVLVIPFDREFSNMSAHDFLNEIVVKKFKPSHVIVGYDHHFGHERGGSSKILESFGKKNNFEVEVIGPVSDEEIIISSTHIRKLINSGYVRRASFELGWVYGFKAKVVHGSGRGRNMKFPTANFIPLDENQLIPANGVYFTRGRINGKSLYGMCNLGVRPTFFEKEFVMEVNFFKNDLNRLYNSVIEVEFLERIRDEKKFSDQEALIEQLIKDKKTCLDLLKKYN